MGEEEEQENEADEHTRGRNSEEKEKQADAGVMNPIHRPGKKNTAEKDYNKLYVLNPSPSIELRGVKGT